MADDSIAPDSPLSSISSPEAFEDDSYAYTPLRPAKRQRVTEELEAETEHETLEGMSDISSDTSGDIPHSPSVPRVDEEDYQEQVTVCDWEGCEAGDLRNMDRLVEHIHNSHIENRQKKYTCEWRTCIRKGLTHASGYALKAHMRSHTREKPFYCYLPGKCKLCSRFHVKKQLLIGCIECDRSFTRSDALAKHMRTVHETEALRPSDPVPKSMHPAGPSGKGKLKIIIKTGQSQNLGQDDIDESSASEEHAEYFTPLTKELFDEGELAFSVDKLYRKCHWESKWAEETGEALRKECKEWEELYYNEWLEKEALLSQVIESEVDWHDRRLAILSGAADVQLPSLLEDPIAKKSLDANGVPDEGSLAVSVEKDGASPMDVASIVATTETA